MQQGQFKGLCVAVSGFAHGHTSPIKCQASQPHCVFLFSEANPHEYMYTSACLVNYRRAQHFATFHDEDAEQEAGNVHAGGNEVGRGVTIGTATAKLHCGRAHRTMPIFFDTCQSSHQHVMSVVYAIHSAAWHAMAVPLGFIIPNHAYMPLAKASANLNHISLMCACAQARTLGPWSSAYELVNAREQAAEERRQKVARGMVLPHQPFRFATLLSILIPPMFISHSRQAQTHSLIHIHAHAFTHTQMYMLQVASNIHIVSYSSHAFVMLHYTMKHVGWISSRLTWRACADLMSCLAQEAQARRAQRMKLQQSFSKAGCPLGTQAPQGFPPARLVHAWIKNGLFFMQLAVAGALSGISCSGAGNMHLALGPAAYLADSVLG